MSACDVCRSTVTPCEIHALSPHCIAINTADPPIPSFNDCSGRECQHVMPQTLLLLMLLQSVPPFDHHVLPQTLRNQHRSDYDKHWPFSLLTLPLNADARPILPFDNPCWSEWQRPLPPNAVIPSVQSIKQPVSPLKWINTTTPCCGTMGKKELNNMEPFSCLSRPIQFAARDHILRSHHCEEITNPVKLFLRGVLIWITHLLLIVLVRIIIIPFLQDKYHTVVGGRCWFRKYHGCGECGYLLVLVTFDVPFTRSPAHQQMVGIACGILDTIREHKHSLFKTLGWYLSIIMWAKSDKILCISKIICNYHIY